MFFQEDGEIKKNIKKKRDKLKKIKYYISDIIKEEDTRECLILYLRLIDEYKTNYITHIDKYRLSFHSYCSNCTLYYLLSENKLKYY